MGEEMGGDTRYTTAIGHALCSVASGVALSIVIKKHVSSQFPTWALGCAFGSSVIGALVYGVPRLEEYRPHHRRAHFLMHCVMVPLLSMHFSLANNYDAELSYIQLVFPVFPIVANLMNDRNQYPLQDAVVGGTLAFKTFMHFQSKNYYGLAYCVSYAITHFVIGSEGTVGEVPAVDLHSIGFLFSMFFITKALYS